MIKKCNTCKKENGINQFHKGHGWCKECNKIYCRANYDAEKEKKRKLEAFNNDPEGHRKYYKEKSIKYRLQNKEKCNEYARKSQKKRRDEDKIKYDSQKMCKAVVKWKMCNKKKVRCQRQLQYAVKKGKIIMPFLCELCGKEKKLSGHHENYDRPFEIIWVCRSCHGKLDRERRTRERNNG